MNKIPEISLIIPMYNVQNYIGECIQSVQIQSLENWELILVDDGSTDNTLQICNQYAKHDTRIQVIHQNKTGVSSARNRGINVSKGKYIVFVDGDDILTYNSLYDRVKLMKNAEMGVAAFEVIGEDYEKLKRMPLCVRKSWDRKEAVRNIVIAGEIGYQGYLWNKIFLRDCMVENKLLFNEKISYNEDRLFVVQYAMHCSSIKLCDKIVYLYRKNPNGAMESLKKMSDRDYDNIMSEFLSFQLMCDMMKDYDKEVYDLCVLEAANRAIFLNKMIAKTEKRLKYGMQRKVREYGICAVKGSIPLRKKIKVIGHMLLRR